MQFRIINKTSIIGAIQEFFNTHEIERNYQYIRLHFAHAEDTQRLMDNEISNDEIIEIIGNESYFGAEGVFLRDNTLLDSFDIEEDFNFLSTRQDICAKMLEKEINLSRAYEKYASYWRYEDN
jgi:hypothetical protein